MNLKHRCPIPSCRSWVDAKTRTACKCGYEFTRADSLYFEKRVGASIRRKKYSGPLRTPAVLERAWAEWLISLDVESSNISPAITLKNMNDEYLEYMRITGKKSRRSVLLFLARFLEYFGDISVEELTPQKIEKFKLALRSQNLAEATVDRHLAAGKAAFERSISHMPNPFKSVKLFRPDNTLVRWLEPEEEQNLLAAALKLSRKDCGRKSRGGDGTGRRAHPWLYAMIVVAINTGLREENVLNLHVSEAHLWERLIIIRQKGDTKHTVPMNQAAHSVLQDITPSLDGWFFPNPKTGEPYLQIAKGFSSAKKWAGITKPFRFHDLRHHFATKILRLTGNLALVQRLLGHSRIETTMKYAHVLQEDLNAALAMLCEDVPGKHIPRSIPEPIISQVSN
jgi:integrase